jgi:hypothetical protein
VSKSGASGTVRIYDQTAVTGATSISIVAGAGQGTTNFLQFQNLAGSYQGQISSDASISTGTPSKRKIGLIASIPGISASSDSVIQFRSADSLDTGSADAGLGRNAADVVEVNNGTLGTLRDLRLRSILATGGTFYDTTSTTVTVRAGSAQANPLISLRDTANIQQTGAEADGSFNSYGSGVRKIVLYQTTHSHSSDSCESWFNNTDVDAVGAAADSGICRNAAGVLEINNGTPGTYRDMKFRNLTLTGLSGSGTKYVCVDNSGNLSVGSSC